MYKHTTHIIICSAALTKLIMYVHHENANISRLTIWIETSGLAHIRANTTTRVEIFTKIIIPEV